MAFTVPGYQVGSLLGRGSHATVWSAVHKASGEQVALKRVEAASANGCIDLRKEANLLQSLQHPSLIRFLGFVELPGAAVLILELAEGGSLSGVLSRRQHLAASEVAMSFGDLGAALAHAHEAGVVHGDISSANILYTSAGRPKLADLGLARLAGGSSEIIGTPAYLDPAVAAGGPVGVTSDLFSLGAVALHAVSGRQPWRGSSVEEVLLMAARGDIEDLSDQLAPCPPLMRQALGRVLHREPLRRGTAAEFALALRATTDPTPVVLDAGRVNPGRHSAGRLALPQTTHDAPDRVGANGGARTADGAGQAAPGRAVTQLDRPAFQRPGPAQTPQSLNAAQLTHVSRPQLRRQLAAEPPHARSGRWQLRAALAVTAMVIVACAVAVASGWWRPSVASALPWHDSTAATPRPDAVDAKPSTDRADTTPAADLGAAGSGSDGVSMDSTTATRILQRLDAIRARAYALNQPDLLEQVYSGAQVSRVDTAQLAANVPVGCVLTGLQSTYSHVSVFYQEPGSVEVSATVAIAGAQRSCHGTDSGMSAPTQPAAYAITLSGDDKAGYRIASQTLLLGGA